MGDGMLFVISLGITLLGLVISYGVGKRRGAASGLRGAAWSLVPLAATLTVVVFFAHVALRSLSLWIERHAPPEDDGPR